MQNVLLKADNITIAINDKRRISIDFSLEHGQFARIPGKSGSGKSTALKTLARLHSAAEGTILLEGSNSGEIPPNLWRRRVIYISQYPVMMPGSVLENLQMPFKFRASEKSVFQLEKAEEYLEKLGLNTGILHQDAGSLSGGEAARVSLVRALLCNPKVLLTDELTAPLDDESADQAVALIREWMKDGTKGLIVAAHRAEIWDDLINFNIAIN